MRIHKRHLFHRSFNTLYMNNTETLVDESGIELLVNYDCEKADYEDQDSFTPTATMTCTELKSVEIVIAGIGIELLDKMNDRQKKAIISQLTDK